MANLSVLASDLHFTGQTSGTEVIAFSNNNNESTVYIYQRGDNLVYSLEYSESQLLYSKTRDLPVRRFLFPSPPLAIISISAFHCILLENGSIYRVSDSLKCLASVCFRNEKEDLSANIIRIPESHKLFQNINCKAICALRHLLCMIYCDKLQWSVNVCTLVNSSTNQLTIKQLFTADMPTKKKMPLHPVIASFVIDDGPSDNTLDSQLFRCIFGCELPNRCEGILMLSIGDGEIFCIPIVNELNYEACILPLFCLHEPVVQIQKFAVKTDCSSTEVGILLVGVSGKVVALSKSSRNTGLGMGLNITEAYVPGPICRWSGLPGMAYHADQRSLWKTVFELKTCNDEVSTIILNTTDEYQIGACGLHLYNNQDNQPVSVVSTEDGRLLLVPNCHKSDINLSTNFPHVNPVGLKELLSEIHACSVQLSRVNQCQEERKNLLSEIACAAHLILNEKVKKDFTIVITPTWTSAEPSDITVAVNCTNTGDFSIIGNHWHLVTTLTTSSDYCVTKSVPLNFGLESGQSAEVIIKLHLSDFVCDNDFPLILNCGLQLFLDVKNQDVKQNVLRTCGYQAPITFYVKIQDFSLDELWFISSNVSIQSALSEPCISDALWEMARRRQAESLPSLESPPQIFNKSSYFNSINVKRSYVEKFLKKMGMSEGSILSSYLLFYIVNNIKMDLPNDVCSAELSLFGHKFKIDIQDLGKNIRINVHVWHPSLLLKLRRAIVNKLKLIIDQCSIGGNTKNKQPKGFLLSPTIHLACSSLHTRLVQLTSLQDEPAYGNQTLHMYAEMRESVSSELPFI